jgi:outer membrane protein insertion porin family
MKLAWFADAGQLLDYVGPTSWLGATPGAGGSQTGQGSMQNLISSGNGGVRSSVGMGLLWDSPFGPLRFDLAYALTKDPYDKTQLFRFGGGGKF